eukprot:gene10558-biopygen13081
MSYTRCFNPFNVHKKEVKGGLSKVTILLAKDVVTLGIDVVPGQKICPSCRIKVKTEIDSFGKELVQSDEEVNLVETLDNELSFTSNKESIDSALSEIDVKAAREFKVSKKTIQKAQRLKEEKGILEMPDLAAGKTLDNDVIDAVDAMYNDDEFTRQLPGEKHCSVDDSDEESDVERENIDDMEECITYKQWTTTDRAELISVTATVEEFIEVLMKYKVTTGIRNNAHSIP